MEEKIFDIVFEDKGQKYTGWVNPSDEMNDKGTPVSFHVVLNGVSFGYLSYNNCKWIVNEDRPSSITEAAGKEIEKHYSL
jgi:hypothetical protein